MVDFTTTIYGVQVDIEATTYAGEIDDFTVYTGNVDITELLSDKVVDILKERAKEESKL